MTKTQHIPKEQRRELLLSAAIKLANANGLFSFTLSNVCALCEVETTVRTARYVFTIEELRKAVAEDDRTSKKVKRVAMEAKIIDAELY